MNQLKRLCTGSEKVQLIHTATMICSASPPHRPARAMPSDGIIQIRRPIATKGRLSNRGTCMIAMYSQPREGADARRHVMIYFIFLELLLSSVKTLMMSILIDYWTSGKTSRHSHCVVDYVSSLQRFAHGDGSIFLLGSFLHSGLWHTYCKLREQLLHGWNRLAQKRHETRK